MTENYSNEVKAEALKIAKGTQRPGQTKEQTRLIAQGIEKGIAEYRKNEKSKARDRDKARKKQARAKQVEDAEQEVVVGCRPQAKFPSMDVTADELDRLRRVPLLPVTQMNAEAGQDIDGRPVE